MPEYGENYNFAPQILKLYRDLLDFRARENNAFAWLIT
jgi:hypothetical protein